MKNDAAIEVALINANVKREIADVDTEIKDKEIESKKEIETTKSIYDYKKAQNINKQQTKK